MADLTEKITEIAGAVKNKLDSVKQSNPDYTVNYNDKRFAEVESNKTAALNELEKTYSGMIGESDKYYQDQIDASKQWADKQTQLQQDQTNFAIEQIEQQKQQTHSDYLKEQSGAYADWQKQSNQYGANSERMASSGLTNTGYSESSQVAMYNTYQNRVATARESYNRAVLNYDNAIKDARLQNNAALAEIAFNTLQQQLKLSLQGFQYKNTLVLDQANKELQIEDSYYNRYQDVLAQINQEHALAEEIRQYNQSLEMDKAQLAEQQRQFNFVNKLGEFAETASTSSGTSSGSGSISAASAKANQSKKSSSSSVKLDSGSSSSDSSADAYFNKLISTGTTSSGTADYTTQKGQQDMKSTVNAEINAAVKAGAITQAEAKKLKETYAPRGLTY